MFLRLFQIPQRYRFSSKSQQYFALIYSARCCFRYHKGTDFQANHNTLRKQTHVEFVVLDTTKVQIFKQITTAPGVDYNLSCCFRYHKGTDFQANHNKMRGNQHYILLFQIPQRYRFSSKSQLLRLLDLCLFSCFRYHKGTDFQANHNLVRTLLQPSEVVLDTTKVQIFKQITTTCKRSCIEVSCFRYHKGTDFQANHNYCFYTYPDDFVVLDTTKVQIFKQITTGLGYSLDPLSCFRYHKGTDFQANHNIKLLCKTLVCVVLDTTKVQIFKQITTKLVDFSHVERLFQIPQRYRFSSKSQHVPIFILYLSVVLDTTKVQIFKQITT